MMRPGPARLAGQLCPGGYVLHVYGLPGLRLLWADAVNVHNVERQALDAVAVADAAGCHETVHVAYDGDTGRRLDVAEWLAILWDART